MNSEGVVGIFLVALLLGGMLLFIRRPSHSYASEPRQGNIKVIPSNERRYQNKEIRNIEYNDDGLPIKIEIIRDYAIT